MTTSLTDLNADVLTVLRNEVLAVLRAEIRKVREDLPADVEGTALLLTDLQLDSLDVVEFVARIEEAYRFSVPDEDWQALRCLDLVADYVLAHR